VEGKIIVSFYDNLELHTKIGLRLSTFIQNTVDKNEQYRRTVTDDSLLIVWKYRPISVSGILWHDTCCYPIIAMVLLDV